MYRSTEKSTEPEKNLPNRWELIDFLGFPPIVLSRRVSAAGSAHRAGQPQKEYGYRNGELLVVAESSSVKWRVSDHLGSTRMMVAENGSLTGIERHDYLPFGEELGPGVGNRGAEFGALDPRQKFTGYERDIETSLDFAQARYFASVQGRFTSPDPIYFQAGMATDPQRFNLYSYTRNNPLRFTDPDGEKLRVEGMPDWLRLFVLNPMAGGDEEFNRYFYVDNGQVQIREGVDRANLNAGAQLLYDMVSSTDTYVYFAGTNGQQAADMFNAEGQERQNIIRDFEGTDRQSPSSVLVGTRGRYGTPQPRDAGVFAVIAVNPNTISTQTGITGSEGSYEVFFSQLEGLNQTVRPVSRFIHESAENLVFAETNPRPEMTDRAGWNILYGRAHGEAKRREATIRQELRIPGGFSGGALTARRGGQR